MSNFNSRNSSKKGASGNFESIKNRHNTDLVNRSTSTNNFSTSSTPTSIHTSSSSLLGNCEEERKDRKSQIGSLQFFSNNFLRKIHVALKFDRKTRLRLFLLIMIVLMTTFFLSSFLFFTSDNQSSSVPLTPSSSSKALTEKINNSKNIQDEFTSLTKNYKSTFGDNFILGKNIFTQSNGCSTDDNSCSIFYPLLDLTDHISEEEELRKMSPMFQGRGFSLTNFDKNVKNTKDQNQITKAKIISLLLPSSSSSLTADDKKIRDLVKKYVSLDNNKAPAHGVILSRRGYKGGKPQDQINQDRAAIISPFPIDTLFSSSNENFPFSTQFKSFFIGLWDGHGSRGHVISEFCQLTLPSIFASTLEKQLMDNNYKNKSSEITQDRQKEDRGGEHHHGSKLSQMLFKKLTTKNDQRKYHQQQPNNPSEEQTIIQALKDTFIQVDRNAPPQRRGSGTTSVVAYCCVGSKLFVANVGDSSLFLLSFSRTDGDNNINENNVQIHYITKKHKPHMPEERSRIEKLGGTVIETPPLFSPDEEVSSRIVVNFDSPPMSALSSQKKLHEYMKGHDDDFFLMETVSLAMSRSIGDEELSKKGVIAEATVDVIDLEHVLSNIQNELVYVVAASDGLLDHINPMDIAKALQEEQRQIIEECGRNNISSSVICEQYSIINTCERLILKASELWFKNTSPFPYRDDITIAVQKLSKVI